MPGVVRRSRPELADRVMKVRALLIGAGVLALLLVALSPMTIVAVTGRPLVIDCGDTEPAACDELWRSVASDMERLEGASGPVTGVHVDGAEIGRAHV